jgi:hypothetical protein
MEVQILDDRGTKALSKPIKATYKNEDAKAAKNIRKVNFDGFFALNRVGNVTLRFTFTDSVGNQEANFEVPLRVTQP